MKEGSRREGPSSHMPPVQSVPDTVLEKIFLLIHFPARHNVLPLVSRQFARVAASPSCWAPGVEVCRDQEEGLGDWLLGGQPLADIGRRACPGLPAWLRTRGVRLWDFSFIGFHERPRRNRQNKLSFSRHHWRAPWMQELLASLPRGLRSLELDLVGGLRDEDDLSRVLHGVGSLTALTSLSLAGHLDAPAELLDVPLAPLATTLRHLTLDCVTSPGFQRSEDNALAHALGFDVWQQQQPTLPWALAGMTSLTSLRCRFGARYLEPFAVPRWLSRLQALESLSLSRCDLLVPGGQGLRGVSTMTQLTELRVLDEVAAGGVASSAISEAADVLEGLQGMAALRVLRLDAFMEGPLPDWLPLCLTHLSTLDLRQATGPAAAPEAAIMDLPHGMLSADGTLRPGLTVAGPFRNWGCALDMLAAAGSTVP